VPIMIHPSEIGISTARPSLDIDSIDIAEDTDIRSPRTPIYQPTSPSSTSLSPFDPAKLFASQNAPLKPTTALPTKKTLPPPPSDPLAWVWQCHLCRSRWPLGVTRRCLIDGHFYCSGDTQPNVKRKKRGQSCSSEFDYVGWKDWGTWRRRALKTMSNPRIPAGCERCEYPSQCRYAAEETSLISDQPSSSPMAVLEYASSSAEGDKARYYSKEGVTFESIFAKAEAAGKSVQSKMTDFHEADHPIKRSKSVGGNSGEQVAASIKRRTFKKSTLSPIEEEALRGPNGAGLQDLVMPLVEFLAYNKEKRKSLP
jgi:hypothetical protein